MDTQDTPWAHEKSWREVREYLGSGQDLALLPVGSVEQHGPHMPMGHDAFAAHYVARDAGQRAGVLVYPTLWYGWSNNHMALPGTVNAQARNPDRDRDRHHREHPLPRLQPG